ncbi:Hsp20/alpha crystallin family protein [Celerinatantimonas sp. MCCC 1A17872]|uniref:Hsp20/alpha crystallin family protein n=1 Tax=Celerinatantimonas sp. MCCC 1A17872 TaxID=3177514 RepID=UPI0038C66989
MNMKLRPWNPTEDFDDMIHRLMNWPSPFADQKRRWMPATDIVEAADRYELKVELPEMRKEDIKVSLEDGYLVLSGERSHEKTDEKLQLNERFYGQFTRRYELPSDVKTDGIDARFENGMLYLSLPKTKVSEPETQHIEIH